MKKLGYIVQLESESLHGMSALVFLSLLSNITTGEAAPSPIANFESGHSTNRHYESSIMFPDSKSEDFSREHVRLKIPVYKVPNEKNYFPKGDEGTLFFFSEPQQVEAYSHRPLTRERTEAPEVKMGDLFEEYGEEGEMGQRGSEIETTKVVKSKRYPTNHGYTETKSNLIDDDRSLEPFIGEFQKYLIDTNYYGRRSTTQASATAGDSPATEKPSEFSLQQAGLPELICPKGQVKFRDQCKKLLQ